MRRRCLHPVHNRRRRPLRGRRPGGIGRRRRQGVGELGGRGASGVAGGDGGGVRRPVRGAGDRRTPRGRRLRRVRGRRPPASGTRRDRLGARGSAARSGGDLAHEHGSRWHRGRLRARADARRGGCRGRASDRLRRCRLARTPRGRRRARRRRCGALRIDLPLRAAHGPGGQGADARGGDSGSLVMPRGEVDLRERVRRLPGMEQLLPALEGLPPTYLVGGAVRDLLRGADAVDLDLAVEGNARSVARALAERLGGEAREHERFGTATVRAGDLVFDLATTRRETYDEPGALPRVTEAPLDEDLSRRDFTINAMAVGLTGDDLGHLYDPRGGLTDLDQGVVRVLHEGSFIDDPTRLLRAVRYEVRLGFRMDPVTERLARAAAIEGALQTVSGGRVRDELMDLLGEAQAPAGVRRMGELGLDLALHPALRADPE